MKVSIIVPTFNRANMLRETLESILQQTFQDFEIIIMDNCSSDNTEPMINSYNDERIRYFKHQNHGILAINMNYGMKQARGEYIAFCDDDDLWMPDKLEKQIAEFQKDDQVALVCTNGIVFNENGDVGVAIKSKLTDRDFTMIALLWNNTVISSSILLKKSVINEVGMMDEEPEIFGAEEYSLWIRIAKIYKVKYIDLPLIKYRTHVGVFRNKGLDILIVDEIIYKKLLRNKIIDIELYTKLIRKLNYRTLALKLVLGDTAVNLQTIRQTEMTIFEKWKVAMIYLLFRIGVLDTMRHLPVVLKVKI